jgi:type 1 glutamine amidotransferase
MFHRIVLSLLLLLPGVLYAQDKATEDTKAPTALRAKKVVLIAGKKSHGPEGNGIHDYPWSVKLLKAMLDESNVNDQLRVEFYLGGWPKNPDTLNDADTILIVSDGRDGDKYEEAPHLASPERVRFFDKQIKRGCGLVLIHFSTFAPNKYQDHILDWAGGFFQWETAGKREWYSAIRTLDKAEVQLATPEHAVLRGVKPFTLREEFYFNIRFRNDKNLTPLWSVPALKGRKPDGDIVAWANERPKADGGSRGFATTCGHFYDNWKNDDFRKTLLNAIVWTAKVDVPKGGVESRFLSHAEIESRVKPIRALLLAGNDAHKWHNWEKTTPAIKKLLEREERITVDVSNDIEDLAKKKLSEYDVIVQNYCNWHDPKGLSELGKRALVKYLDNGGGLLVIHFANGAFHLSLPKARESDWPEYRAMVRRVWDHEGKGDQRSGHDAFGKFTVEITKSKHAITAGLKAFEVEDELYFNQAGKEKIEPLLTARSKVTKKDEPLAFAYEYSKGRVFQILLGHSEKTYDTYEPREILRRAAAWAARREIRPMTAEREGWGK